jgi:N utilization substance protein A
VESAMAALVPTGAPVSILIDHGLADDIVEKLIEAGVGTVEKLGAMTPEELEAIPSIEPEIVEKILVAVNSYYSQFETTPETAEITAESGDVSAAEPVEAPNEEAVETVEASSVEGSETLEPVAVDSSASKKEFDTIKNSEEAG